MIYTPREYQLNDFERIRAEYRAGADSVLHVSPTGSGKTIVECMIAMAARKKNNPVLILTHRDNILRQFIKKLQEFGLQFGVIAAGYPTIRYKIQVASVQTLHRRLHQWSAGDFKLIIIDECFLAGTKINTIKGKKNIEKIKKGEYVYTLNEKTHKLEIKQVEKLIVKETDKKLITINNSITCTEDHLIYTKSGWKKAKTLKKGVDVMLNIMYNYNYEMLYMQRTNTITRQTQKISIQKNRKSVLFKKMFWRIQKKNIFHYNGRNKQKICIGENEEKQSYEKSYFKGKNENNPKGNRTQTENTRWKWKGSNSSSAFIGKCYRMGYGSCCENENEKRFWISNLLQNRCSKRNIKNRYRSRRKFTRYDKKTRARYKENGIFKWIRVENIKIQKSGNRKKSRRMCEKNTVYDLSVKDNHNYFANDILVHNCHHILAKTWSDIINHFSHAKIYGATATPIRLDGQGLGNFFETMVIGPRYDYLVSKGFLSDPKYYVPEHIKLSDIKLTAGDYNRKQLVQRVDKRKITGNAIEYYAKLCDREPAMVFCVSIEHAEHVAEQFRRAGYKAESIHSKLSYEENTRILQNLTDGKIDIVTSCEKVSEGFDVPVLKAVILLRPTQSLCINHQQNGRGSRPYPGKKYSIHIDCAGNCEYHGFIDVPIKWELTTGKYSPQIAGVKICQYCFAAYPANMKKCPECGLQNISRGSRGEPIQVAGNLKEIDYKGRNRLYEEAETLSDFVKISVMYGYKEGHGYHMWEQKQRKKEARLNE